MTLETQTLIRDFSVGVIDESRRLEMERLLLTDTEVLLDYLELKREMESAVAIPRFPSESLWGRLQQKVAPRKRQIFLSVGGVVVLGLIFCFMLAMQPRGHVRSASADRLLFDSSRELPVNSDVL